MGGLYFFPTRSQSSHSGRVTVVRSQKVVPRTLIASSKRNCQDSSFCLAGTVELDAHPAFVTDTDSDSDDSCLFFQSTERAHSHKHASTSIQSNATSKSTTYQVRQVLSHNTIATQSPSHSTPVNVQHQAAARASDRAAPGLCTDENEPPQLDRNSNGTSQTAATETIGKPAERHKCNNSHSRGKVHRKADKTAHKFPGKTAHSARKAYHQGENKRTPGKHSNEHRVHSNTKAARQNVGKARDGDARVGHRHAALEGIQALAAALMEQLVEFRVELDAATPLTDKATQALLSILPPPGPSATTPSAKTAANAPKRQLQGNVKGNASCGLNELTAADVQCLLSELGKQGGVEVALFFFQVLDSCPLAYEVRSPGSARCILMLCEQRAAGREALIFLESTRQMGITLNVAHYNAAIGACAKAGMVEEAEALFKRLPSLGFSNHNVFSYTNLIMAYEKAGHWEKALSTFHEMREVGVERSTFTYRALISALETGGQLELPFQALEWMKEDGVGGNALVYQALLTACIGASRMDKIDSVASQMVVDGIQFDAQAVCRIIRYCSLNRKAEQLFVVLKALRVKGVLCLGNTGRSRRFVDNGDGVNGALIAYNRLMGLMREGRQWKGALEIFEWAVEEGIIADSLYRKLIFTLSDAQRWREVMEVLDRLRRLVPPRQLPFKEVIVSLAASQRWEVALTLLREMHDVINPQETSVHTSLVALAVKEGDLDKAFQVYNMMREDHIPPCLPTYNALISACQLRADTVQAQQVYQDMEAAGVAGDMVTFCALISTHEKARDWVGAEKVWQQMDTLGVDRDTVCYNAMISAYEKGGQVDKALALFTSMQHQGVWGNSTTYSALCDVLYKTGKWSLLKTAQQVKEWMEGQGVQPEEVTYQQLVNRFGRGGQWSRVLELFEEMEGQRVIPNQTTYSGVFTACARVGHLDKALEVKEHMEACGIPHNQFTYNSLLAVCEAAARLDVALEVYEEMKSHGVPPDVVSYTTLISCCAKNASSFPTAAKLFQQMRQENVSPNQFTFNAMIAACSVAGRWQAAQQLYRIMLSQGIEVDAVTVGCMCDVLGRAGRWDSAVQLFYRAIKTGVLDSMTFDITSRKAATVDLHKLSETSAEVALRAWLRYLKQQATQGRTVGSSNVHIITGWGRHSTEKPKLRPMVLRLLEGGALGRPVTAVCPQNNPGQVLVATDALYSWLLSDDVEV